MGLIDAMVYKLWSWMNSHKTAYAAHIANAAAHHTKYTDAEVDAIVATHTAIGAAHHTKYTDAEVDAIVLTHKNIAAAHHTKYTDAEVDAIVLTHKNIAAAHHTKYTDAEAVSAVDTADDYVKNTGDTMTDELSVSKSDMIGGITIESENDSGIGYPGETVKNYAGASWGHPYSGFYNAAGSKASPSILAANITTGVFVFYAHNGSVFKETARFGGRTSPTFDTTHQDGSLEFWTGHNAVGSNLRMAILTGGNIDIKNNKIQDPKNHAASPLSGTKKLVEIEIGGTAYYFEVYPTKA
jgi:uncharacterized protein YejL (UPF0352 family)